MMNRGPESDWLHSPVSWVGHRYIEFGAASAATAVDKMVARNGSEFMGRPVRVDYAVAKPQARPDDEQPA